MRLANKVALVAGGASGIGAATAMVFSKEGAGVVVADIQDDLGSALVAEINGAGGEAVFQHLDVRRSGQWPGAVRAAVDRFGQLDIMVHSAGANFRVGFEEQTEEMWDHVMDVNVKGCFLGIRAVVPEMRRAGGGAIILIASVAGARGARGGPAYSASKAAVVNLARCAALTYAQDRIRVNSVLPGSVDTPFLRGVKSYSLNTPQTDIDIPENYRRRVEATPLGRLAIPEEIAYGALYLASDEASWVTGAGLVIDGGMLA